MCFNLHSHLIKMISSDDKKPQNPYQKKWNILIFKKKKTIYGKGTNIYCSSTYLRRYIRVTLWNLLIVNHYKQRTGLPISIDWIYILNWWLLTWNSSLFFMLQKITNKDQIAFFFFYYMHHFKKTFERFDI